MRTESKVRLLEVLKFSGAFIAWVIGSGFATGQEILRFFTSYGYWSYGVVLIDLAGFLLLGQTLMITGYEHKREKNFRHFEYYCGKRLGRIYLWATPVILFLVMSVLFSAAGSTLAEYYDFDHVIGAALMALLVLAVYLIGFERFIQIVSKIGPLVIIFCLLVGVFSAVQAMDHFGEAAAYTQTLAAAQASPSWILSAVLYLSLDFLTGSTYYTNLGAAAHRREDAKWGAVLGSAALLLAIGVMNTAILLNGQDAAALAIPTLYLAQKLSRVLGAVFSVVLLLGMFSSCAATMWSICSGLSADNVRRNRVIAVLVAAGALTLGLLPFGQLVGVLFPLIGYFGLIYIACVACKGLRRQREKTDERFHQKKNVQ